MLVITSQFSYTQETIYNALMKTAMLKKRNHCPNIKVLTARQDQYTTLPCKLNREKPVTLTLPYSALSVCLYDLSAHHLAFQLLCCPEKKEIIKKTSQ